jgi:hypothetical protein
VDWFEFSLIAVASAALLAWGRHVYAWPNRMSRWWYDTNRIHLAYSKIAGVLLIFSGFLAVTFALVFKLQLLASWEGLLPVPVSLLGTTLLRPRRKTQLPWHHKT